MEFLGGGPHAKVTCMCYSKLICKNGCLSQDSFFLFTKTLQTLWNVVVHFLTNLLHGDDIHHYVWTDLAQMVLKKKMIGDYVYIIWYWCTHYLLHYNSVLLSSLTVQLISTVVNVLKYVGSLWIYWVKQWLVWQI